MPERSFSLPEVAAYLNSPPPVVNAIAVSGLLGHWKDRVPFKNVDQFRRFGTQWTTVSPRRLSHEHPATTPATLKSPSAEIMPSAQTQLQIVPEPMSFSAADQDTGWIGQFYLRVNPFFFPPQEGLALIGPVGLRLNRRRMVKGTVAPCYLFPDPDGNLAMLTVIGSGRSDSDESFERAYDVASHVLDELSLTYDVPLPVAHHMIIGVPSGVITLSMPQPAVTSVLPAGELFTQSPVQLQEAVALYREGLSSSSPFHRFLALWRAYENACGVRGDWKRRNKRRDLKSAAEVFPPSGWFTQYAGLEFDNVKQLLNEPFRVALAHGHVTGGKPRTGASAKDYNAVTRVVPAIRFMARVTIHNVIHTITAG